MAAQAAVYGCALHNPGASFTQTAMKVPLPRVEQSAFCTVVPCQEVIKTNGKKYSKGFVLCGLCGRYRSSTEWSGRSLLRRWHLQETRGEAMCEEEHFRQREPSVQRS